MSRAGNKVEFRSGSVNRRCPPDFSFIIALPVGLYPWRSSAHAAALSRLASPRLVPPRLASPRHTEPKVNRDSRGSGRQNYRFFVAAKRESAPALSTQTLFCLRGISFASTLPILGFTSPITRSSPVYKRTPPLLPVFDCRVASGRQRFLLRLIPWITTVGVSSERKSRK